jgi:hypothetical protein
MQFNAVFDNIFNHPLLSPNDINFASLGSFSVDVDPNTGKLLPITKITPNEKFGLLNSSFSQENVDNRRSIRLALRLTF